MTLPLVLLTHTLPSAWVSTLTDRVQIINGPVDATNLDPAFEPHLPVAEGILCLLTIPIRRELLDRMPNLRVVSNMAVGYDNIDVPLCTSRGIPVGNTPGVLTEATADLTMALLLSAARRLPEASLDAKEGRWSAWRPAGWLGSDLYGAKLGIIGMGKIGKAVAERAKGFGMKIIYTDEIARPAVEASMGAVRFPFEAILRQSDYVSLHAPLTPATRGLINTAALHLMKPNAILINAARGPMVDMNALVQALQEGWITAAALDVTDPEPLPHDHPLYSLPNCLIVPHIGSATGNVRRRMAEMACENLLAGLEGHPLPYCVNPEIYSQVLKTER
jgi:lactate dehydrogenase-like 2-hydroxyacid dehydrogenase